MSPECFQVGEVTVLSDIWSFGCTFYELIELKKAFDQETMYTIMNAIIKSPIPQTDSEEEGFNFILNKY